MVVFAPCNASHVLLVNPLTLELCEGGEDLGDEPGKFMGCCATEAGVVFCAPFDFPRVLRISAHLPESERDGTVERDGEKEGAVESRVRASSVEDLTDGRSPRTPLPGLFGRSLKRTSSFNKRSSDGAAGSSPPLLDHDFDPTWPPALATHFVGRSMAGEGKFVDSVLAADGVTVIGVPYNVRGPSSPPSRAWEVATVWSYDLNRVFTFHCLPLRFPPSLCVGLKETRFLGIHELGGGEVGVDLFGPPLGVAVRERHSSGVLSVDGFLFAAPLSARRFLRLDSLAARRALAAIPAAAKTEGAKRRVSTAANDHSRDHPKAAPSPVRYLPRPASEISRILGGDGPSLPAKLCSMRDVAVVVAGGLHWRRWAARRARARSGVSACDLVALVNDDAMKKVFTESPETWCFGLTLLDSMLSTDLLNWSLRFPPGFPNLHKSLVTPERSLMFLLAPY